jgi:class 3 adenylate cyclase
MEPGFTPDELAERAGVSPEFVDRLTSLGLITPDSSSDVFVPGDVYRIRFVLACEQAGMRAEAIAKGIAAGRISLRYMDLPHYRWATLATKTYAELARESGLDLDLMLDLVQVLGVARPKPEDRIREDDLAIFPVIQTAGTMLSRDELLRTARVYVDSLRRISDAEATLFENLIIPTFEKQGLDWVQAVDMANQFGAQVTPMQEQMILTLYRRMQERRWNEVSIEGIEGVLEEMGLYDRPARPPAFSFVDLAGYTRLTEERGDAAVARLAADMAGIVERIAGASGGQVVKWLGDGVMVYFRDPAQSVSATIDIVREAPQHLGTPAHAGVAAGPVVVQDGDYFGRTVNMAARIAAHATAGQTLVSADTAGLSAGDTIRFHELGPVELKGFAQPVVLYEATAAE